jgi:hypothetical protein
VLPETLHTAQKGAEQKAAQLYERLMTLKKEELAGFWSRNCSLDQPAFSSQRQPQHLRLSPVQASSFSA